MKEVSEMLAIAASVTNLQWTTEHHFRHIQNQHEFMRRWAVQFELAYTDFKTIQIALQLAEKTELYERFTKAYQAVYPYEAAFAMDGLEGFNEKFGTQLDDYEQAHDELLAVLKELEQLK